MARSFTDEMTIDPETGLPALPEDLAWKVDRYGSDTLYLMLVSRYEESLGFWAKLFGKKPDVEWVDHYLPGDGGRLSSAVDSATKAGILATATKLYAKAKSHSTKIDYLDDLAGIYPPKSIL